MEAWADALGLPPSEKSRWTAAAWLHDALRDADAGALRAEVPEAFRGLPDDLLHGPAVAARLEGAADPELLDAVRYHTLGSPRFGRLGRALYLADFLEPGRDFAPEWTAALRARMPHDADAVLREVVDARVGHLAAGGHLPHPETRAFHAAVGAGVAAGAASRRWGSSSPWWRSPRWSARPRRGWRRASSARTPRRRGRGRISPPRGRKGCGWRC
jgi:HD superfamily phosphohydrolase YqeK